MCDVILNLNSKLAIERQGQQKVKVTEASTAYIFSLELSYDFKIATPEEQVILQHILV